MSIKAVLFDLDGTLLPMDQDVFVGAYFKGLATHLVPCGYESNKLIKAVWAGTEAMIKNNGEKTNEAVFWDVFTSVFGEGALEDIPHFDKFYSEGFPKIKAVCGYDERAAEIVGMLKAAGLKVVLATNPIFPAIATETRMGWAGLNPSDFELYTTYENSIHAKPDLAYYTDICNELGVRPEDCLMVGNDVDDDMVAEALGMQVFLLTDCLINKKGTDIDKFPHGSFDELKQYIVGIMG